MQVNRIRSRSSHDFYSIDWQRTAIAGQWVAVLAAAAIAMVGIGRFAIADVQPNQAGVVIPAIGFMVVAFSIQAFRLRLEAGRTSDARRATLTVEHRYTTLLDQASELSLVVDSEGRITFANQAVESLLGRQPWELKGTAFVEQVIANEQFRAGWMIEAGRHGYLPVPTRLPMRTADGESVVIEAIATNHLDDDAINGISISARDITAVLRLESERDSAVASDRLTGLPNRDAFMRMCERSLERCSRLQRPVTLAVLDLDNFRLVNDTFGVSVGDQVLRVVGTRLREQATEQELLARLNGDRFAILLEECPRDEVLDRIDRFCRAAMEPLAIDGLSFRPSVSAGISVRTGEQSCLTSELLSEAEAALAAGRKCGSGSICVFDQSMAAPEGRLLLEGELREATEHEQFTVHYQPVVSLAAGDVVEMEALVRWDHPLRGLVAPGEFISVAEDTGLIVPIGWWVLREACEQGARWMAARPTRPITMSVNLSPRMFRQADLAHQVRSVLAATNFPPASLRLEITEGVMIDNRDEATARLHQLKALGVQLAIDDFGTGFSSLSYLQHFPVDVIKIDRSFVAAMSDSRESAEIVRSIVDLAKALNMETTGEGIETVQQLDTLRDLGSDRGQGFLFSRPLPAGELEYLLRSDGQATFAA